jgi:hypothetical protein
MSANGGDKSRYNRLRKQKLLKRLTKASVKAARVATAAPVEGEAVPVEGTVAKTESDQPSN